MSVPVSVRVSLHCMMSTKGYCLDHHEYNVGQWLNGYDTWDWSVAESMERYELNELQCLDRTVYHRLSSVMKLQISAMLRLSVS